MNRKIFKMVMILTVFIAIMTSSGSFAGVTGKITGVIKDNDTGDPLIGANVIVEGT